MNNTSRFTDEISTMNPIGYFNRRRMLQTTACGFGSLALADTFTPQQVRSHRREVHAPTFMDQPWQQSLISARD